MLNATSDNANIDISKLDEVKFIILKRIFENPGIRYREILKLTGISNGVLEYHLKILEGCYKIINVDRYNLANSISFSLMLHMLIPCSKIQYVI
ncbi:MAG TPA: winged helix-turn-helix transcriptional regulator [Nitrososphaeraceae archaeon]|nr:winged helix-turn-helix transcriptional regulator [Nitrososphaeraceae archaeon]